MTPLIAIGAIAGGLLVASLVLRINAIFLFVAFATGALLSHYLGDSANLVISSFYKGGPADAIGPIALLWTPLLLAFFFLRKTLPASTLLLQAVPIIFIATATALLTLMAMPQDFQKTIYNTAIGHQLNNSQDLLISGAGISTFLLILVIGRPRHDDGGKHKKHK